MSEQTKKLNVTDQMSVFFINMVKEDGRSLGFVLTGAVSVATLISLYKIFIKENGLIPIEELPEIKNKELVKECRATGQNFTNNSLTDAAKLLHTLKFINENS